MKNPLVSLITNLRINIKALNDSSIKHEQQLKEQAIKIKDIEDTVIQSQLDTEYLVCLQELNEEE